MLRRDGSKILWGGQTNLCDNGLHGRFVMAAREQMNIVIAGHVDHGKSTVIGRLLADTGSLAEGKLEQVKANCRRNAKPFEYAFLLDALKDEQSQGITIDSARVFFKTAKRDYIIIDAPGHIEFLKNMVTGASRAEAALLVIDAHEGVQENSRRHGYMLSMLGIRQLFVLVNKMDLVDYSQESYNAVVEEYKVFLSKIGMEALFVPVSGKDGDCIAGHGGNMEWYRGAVVLELLDSFSKEPLPCEKDFRMPVQDVYKFTEAGDNRRIIAGSIDSGRISVGDEVVFYPSGKSSIVKSIEAFESPIQTDASAGMATAFTLDKQVYISRGEIAAKAGQSEPEVTTRLEVSLFWMGKKPMVQNKDYLIKLGAAKEEVRLEKVISVIDASDLSSEGVKEEIGYHDVAKCVLSVNKSIAFDLADQIAATSRFVIVDDYEIRGGGIINNALGDDRDEIRDYIMRRNYKWETSRISRDDRAERYNQKATLILITGKKDVGKKRLAKSLEARLFSEGKFVYFLGIGNILYGVDADIKGHNGNSENRREHLRRLAEVSNVMLDAGMILVVTAVSLTQDDLEIINAAVDTDMIEVVWVGDSPTDIDYDVLASGCNVDDDINLIKTAMQEKGIIFRV